MLKPIDKTADAQIQRIEKSGEVYHHPVDEFFNILSYVDHNSIAF